MSKILSFFLSVIMILEAMPIAWVPTLTVDASQQGQQVSTKATGHLYGLSEEGVPSKAMTNSIDISSVSQKVVDGLQHPTGDVSHVVSQLDECEYIVVYLQDVFSTWYYCYDEIMEMRKNGTYNWEEFITERYFPLVEEKVSYLMNQPYADRIVYCIYNECDNAVWFGNYVDGNVLYDEIGRNNFYKAWDMTYDLVKSIDSDALIGGPGFCDYETTKIEGFMDYCVLNNCVPEIMIYHELAYWSIPDWHMHVEDYRRIEAKHGIDALPIVVTEYGTMEDCGNPTTMLHYIIAMEKSGVYGQMAYWRLANNLNDTAADDNSPNSNWWLYRKYAEMDGKLLSVSSKSQTKYNYRERLDGIATLSKNEDTINMIVSGSTEKQAVKVINLDETNLGKKVNVKVECVYYKGLTGVVNEPIILRQYNTNTSFNTVNINIPGTDTDCVYFVTVSPYDEDAAVIRNGNIPVRYEFESGTLLGDAYTYDSAYATTGEAKGMVGGMEKQGDGVKITIKVPEDGNYTLDIIYGNANDGTKSSDRDYVTPIMSIDGNERTLNFPNTIKSEYTDCYTVNVYLKKGKHTIEFKNNGGHFVLDSMLVYQSEGLLNTISVLPDGENAFLAVAPYDGYYFVACASDTTGTIDGAEASFNSGEFVYLRRGLNEIKVNESTDLDFVYYPIGYEDKSQIFTADTLTLSGATVNEDKYGVKYIDGISSENGSASFTVNAPASGDYRVTLNYSANREGGYHAYNVDLVEAMITVDVNGENSQDIFCRSTYSDYTYKTLTFNVTLNEGENVINVYNSGNTLFNNQVSYAPRIESFTVNSVN